MSSTWDPERVTNWLRQAAGLERQLAPVSDVLFEAAALVPDEAVLDVGCGAGPTTRRAAVEVGAGGRVTGLDISADMLAAAAAEPAGEGAAPLDWIEADAAHWDPPAATWDVVLSRFGVMFFDDPAAAFANLAAATAPGGRLAVATWARRDESALFAVPLHAALGALGRDDAGLPDDEGPFSLHAPGVLADLLGRTGWADVRTGTHVLALPFGGGVVPAVAAEGALGFGPTRVATEGVEGEQRAAVVDAIAAALADHLDGDGHVSLAGTVLVTTARRAR